MRKITERLSDTFGADGTSRALLMTETLECRSGGGFHPRCVIHAPRILQNLGVHNFYDEIQLRVLLAGVREKHQRVSQIHLSPRVIPST
jgi:hypothetical protein